MTEYPDSQESERGIATMKLPVDHVIPNPNNPRKTFNEEALEQLAASIRDVGILQPCVVVPVIESPGKFRLVAGERRWRAAQLAGVEWIPCVIRRLTPAQEAKVMLVENLQRADLDPIEEARAYRDLLHDHDYTQEALAAELGVSQPHIANRIRLLDLPDQVTENISRGILSASHGKVLAGYKDLPATFLATIAQRLQEEHIPVAQAAETIQRNIALVGKPLVGDNYSNDQPHFSTKDCNSCQSRAIAKRWGDEKPYCMDATCWNRKQAETHEKAIIKAEKAGKKENFVDLGKLKYGDYEFWYDESSHCYGYDQSECLECEKRKIGKKQNQKVEEARMVCLDLICMQKKKTQAQKARNKAESDKHETERESVRHLVEAKVNRIPVVDWDKICMTVPFGQEDLIYIAARLLVIGSNRNDPAVQADKYLKKRFGIKVEWKSYEAMREGWPKMLDALKSLSNKQLVTIIFEWPALAQGLQGPEKYLLKGDDAE